MFAEKVERKERRKKKKKKILQKGVHGDKTEMLSFLKRTFYY